MTTTKRDIVNRIMKKKTKLNKGDVEKIVNEMFIVMSKALMSNERIEIRGFGSWNVKELPPRTARDPRTGKIVSVPKRKKITFRVGKILMTILNQ